MLDKSNLPKHVAIIMDGNGRWAQERGLPRTIGHREGMKRVRETVKIATELGIKVLTFFAFSAENWSRPQRELDVLMRFLNNFLDKDIDELDKKNVRFRVIGRQAPLPESTITKIRKAQEKTQDNTSLIMVLAINYGGRQEIVDAAKKFASSVISGDALLEGLDEDSFAGYFYTAGLPDPDLLIRTSGEMRISNFLLWQISYTEFYFPKKYWPDFRKQDFEEALMHYQKRERRFGGIDDGKKGN